MATSIALLRGVNVGGATSLAMADLRELLVDAGYENVTTYIQSGNVMLDHTKRSSAQLEDDIGAREAAFGRDVTVVVCSPKLPPVVLKAAQVPASVRNWQTVTKLIELAQAR